MPDWVGNNAQRWETAGSVPATSLGTTITAGAVNVKGAYAELIAATTQPANMLMLMIGGGTLASVEYLLDLAVGAAAAEVPILTNLQISGAPGTTTSIPFLFVTVPLTVNAGERLSARIQASTASATARLVVYALQSTFIAPLPMGLCETWGATTATTRGTAMATGQAAHAESAKTPLIASTPYPVSALMLSIGNQANGVRASANFLHDVFVGAAGSEIAIINDLMVNASSSIDLMHPQLIGPFPVDIPAGTRISVGYRCSVALAATQAHDVTLYGFS